MGDVSIRRRQVWCHVSVMVLVTVLQACQTVSTTSAHHGSRPRVPVSPLAATAVRPVLNPTLTQTVWRIVTIERRPVQMFVQPPHVILHTGATVSGSTGCNTLTGQYTVGATHDGKQTALTLRAVAAQQFCQGALLQEARLFNALDHVRFAKIQGQQLLLLDAAQGVLVVAVSP
ncbi:MAG: putative signal peptide protein [Pseudomonadota bacterium]